jgi:hypothetical protein
MNILDVFGLFGGLACIWWPICIYVFYVHGYVYAMTLVICSVLSPYVPIPLSISRRIDGWIGQTMTILFMEPPAAVGNSPEVVLLIPHGFLCFESFSMFRKWSAEMNMSSTLFLDRLLWRWSPLAIMLLNLMGASHDISRHACIDRYMQATKKHVAAFPGGFAEAVGGTEQEQILSLVTISYWLKQCKRHGYALRVFHTYNGSDMILQSTVCLRFRARLARRFHIPVPLPIRVQSLPSRVVRCLFYDNNDLPVSADTIKEDLLRYVEIDKKSTLFPTPLRTYTTL